MNFKKYHVSKNLFSIDFTHDDYLSLVYHYTISGLTPNNQYTCSSNFVQSGSTASIWFGGTSTGTNGVSDGNPKTMTSNANGEINFYINHNTGNAYSQVVNGTAWVMVNEGSTPLPYEPYSSEVWHDTPHYIHKTDTDTITTPAVIYANDTTATVGLKGNMEQSGAPTPSSPIQPQECGERTENLFDYTRTDGVETKKYINQSGEKVSSNNYNISYPIEVLPNQEYIWSFNTGLNALHTAPTVAFYDSNDNYISVAEHGSSVYWFNFTTPNNCKYVRASVYITQNNTTSQLLVGSSSGSNKNSLPFVPYGIKIPISSAGQTNNIYLGEVQTTRKIRKLVLTGEEEWQFFPDSIGSWQFYINNISLGGVPQSSCVSNIAPYGVTATTRQRYDYGCYLVTSGSGIAFQMKGAKDTFTGITAWKSYLAAQYAAGTPVTVWYVLATEETAVVNEPLMKIGDYADEVSNVSIPVTAGGDTISVGTTVQPSEVTVNYKGWHPVEDVHEADNGAWT